MQKTFDFLKNRTQVNYLATINGEILATEDF